MLNENAKKWVEALRSNRFKQGKYHLEVDNRYCCLGVACMIAIENGLQISHIENTFDREKMYLPKSVEDWLQLIPGTDSNLAILNDEGKSFTEIAAYIESNLERLFQS